MNYVLRSWPWIVVALAAVVLLPDQTDWEQSYPCWRSNCSPCCLGTGRCFPGGRLHEHRQHLGELGASYLTHDLYQRFIRPQAREKELLLVGQLASVLLVVLGCSPP